MPRRYLPPVTADWRAIDGAAKRRLRVLVRAGELYATAYWTGGLTGRWQVWRTVQPLHFEPREYAA